MLNNFFSGGAEICGIFSCLNDKLITCSELISKDHVNAVTFKSINISVTNRQNNDNVFFMPISSKSNLKPLDSSELIFASRNLTMNLTNPVSNLQNFAIIGRVFDYDKRYI